MSILLSANAFTTVSTDRNNAKMTHSTIEGIFIAVSRAWWH